MRLIITQPYINLRGGAERVILKIAQHYNAKILTLEYDKKSTFSEFGDLDIELIGKSVPFADMLPYRASQGLRYGYNFYNIKIKEDYDLINAHISPSEWIRHNNKKVLWYCHTPPREVYDLYAARMKTRSGKDKLIYATFTSAYKLIAKTVVSKLEGIATNSTNTQERIKKFFGKDSTVINPGIDVENFTNNGDEKFFFYPSRILQNKRQHFVIEAFSKFLRNSNADGYKLVIAGTLSKDKEHNEYFEKLKEMQVKNVVFKTNISEKELRDLYSRCTAVLFAAINEDYGFIPLEAMASSKPVITINEGGPKETVLNEVTGFIINSTDEMAEKMQYLAEHPKITEKMGKEGRRRVEEKYSWGEFFKKFDVVARKAANFKE